MIEPSEKAAASPWSADETERLRRRAQLVALKKLELASRRFAGERRAAARAIDDQLTLVDAFAVALCLTMALRILERLYW
jgi:hypothetical protein